MTAKQQLAQYQRAIDWYFALPDSTKVDSLILNLCKAFEIPPHVALVQVYALMTAKRKG